MFKGVKNKVKATMAMIKVAIKAIMAMVKDAIKAIKDINANKAIQVIKSIKFTS